MALDMSVLKSALLYPWNEGNSGTTLVGGGILTLLSPLIVPALLVLGYLLRVVEAGMSGEAQPPRFGAWTELFLDGLKATIVLLLAVVLPLVIGIGLLVLLLGQTGFRFSGGLARMTGPGAVGGLAFIAAVLLGGLVLLVWYVAPAALVHLARTRRLRAALAVDDVSRLARSDAYGSVWLLATAVFAANAVVLAILNAVGVGVILSGFVSFYAFLAMAYLLAHGASETGFDVELDEETVEPSP